jgi:uncharacterized protein
MESLLGSTAKVPQIALDALELILTRVQPQRVILFGSWARGEATVDSDLDLLVVLPFRGPRHRVSISLLTLLANLPAAKDVIVLSPEEWERKKDLPGSIAYPAAHEGVILYAA